MKFKFNTVGSNKNGTKIFCKLYCNNNNVVKGYYDFNIDKFIIMKYLYDKLPKGITKNQIKKELKEILKVNYDWEL